MVKPQCTQALICTPNKSFVSPFAKRQQPPCSNKKSRKKVTDETYSLLDDKEESVV